MASDITFEHVPLSRIGRKPGFNPRQDVGDVSELAASIEANGLIAPIVVCPAGDGTNGMWIVAGARRLAALEKLGRADAPALIRNDLTIGSPEALALATVENEDGDGGRKGLAPLEQARAYARLADLARGAIAAEKGLAADDVKEHHVFRRVAKLLGRTSESKDAGAQHVRMTLRLLDAPTSIQDMLARGEPLPVDFANRVIYYVGP
ncbi:MAG: ParB N-terminal domain-containing protein, partial [Planctomycetes bacterium]|nr:ParB N-terminal domain-containing protein [Planctomycetota bacterium]